MANGFRKESCSGREQIIKGKLFKRFYLFLQRVEGREKVRERNIGPHAPNWGPGPQPRHAP